MSTNLPDIPPPNRAIIPRILAPILKPVKALLWIAIQGLIQHWGVAVFSVIGGALMATLFAIYACDTWPSYAWIVLGISVTFGFVFTGLYFGTLWIFKIWDRALSSSDTQRSLTGQQEVTPREIKSDEPKPNLIPIGYGKRCIVPGVANLTFTEDGDQHIPAVVAQFRNTNDRSKRIEEARDIRAHIYFTPVDYYKDVKQEMVGGAKVDDGIWLDEKDCVINFARGQTKTLIIAVQCGSEILTFQHRIVSEDGVDRLLPRMSTLTADKYHVKVELSGGAQGDVYELFHFYVTLRPEFNISLS